jgi:hypothetical protein
LTKALTEELSGTAGRVEDRKVLEGAYGGERLLHNATRERRWCEVHTDAEIGMSDTNSSLRESWEGQLGIDKGCLAMRLLKYGAGCMPNEQIRV